MKSNLKKREKKIRMSGFNVSCPEKRHAYVYADFEEANDRRVVLDHKYTCSAHSISACEIILNPKKK